MKNGLIMLFPNGKIKQTMNMREAMDKVLKFNRNKTVEYCEDYDLNYDELSKEEASFAGGYENGVIKVFKTNEVIEAIKKSEMIKEEQKILLNKLENSFSTLDTDYYEGLNDLLEDCPEIPVENYFN